MTKYAEILFPQKIIADKETLTYEIPAEFDLQVGQIVKVPLKRNLKIGIVLKLHSQKPSFKTLKIAEMLEYSLDPNQVLLLQWLSKYYFCSISKCLKLFLPPRIIQNKKYKPKENSEQINRTKAKNLTAEQAHTIATIKESKENNFLIQGITGSGKTEIYANLANEQAKQNKQTLILVPEISLTPQIIEYFQQTTGLKAAVIHSKLSESERQNSWISIKQNESKLIIGSRSAIFAPFRNLGMIIIDEEHDPSYKQDNSPRYHTHQVAKKIQELNPEIKIIFGSATPNIETKSRLENSTIKLTKRINNTPLPQIQIVDLRNEFHKGNFSIFSDELQNEIEIALGKKEQIILFLNRRGSASSIVCRDCGFTLKCPNCDIPMTYHEKTFSKANLICHHCGQFDQPPIVCPQCKGANIRYLGIGTQKIENECHKIFPNAKILRADRDSTSKKNAFNEIFQKFKKHEADILIGTQMIAKGLHLPKVSLVGIVLADIGLNLPDFRSTERNFQLITQVSGRAGRSLIQGKVIIQTYNPDHLALKFAEQNDYESFFDYERTQRKLLNNPPFSQLGKITIQDISLNKAQKISRDLEKLISETAKKENINLEINCYPAFLSKLRGKYQQIIFLKSLEQNEIHKLLEKLPKADIIHPNIKIDIDPLNVT